MRTLLIALLLMFCFADGYSQSNRFEHLGSEDGLSQVTVTGIFQDELGRMWFATRDGLNLKRSLE